MGLQRNATRETYLALEKIFNIFNKELFEDQLKPCLITIQRLRGSFGCFNSARYVSRDGVDLADGIVLDARHWGEARSPADNLSTLAHEMTHLWQHHHGKGGRSNYHNWQFARKMSDIGLVTSDTGEPGGKRVGRVSHYIRPSGVFDRLVTRLLQGGVTLPYHERLQRNDAGFVRRRMSKARSKSPYVCLDCYPPVRVWGKPDLRLTCNECATMFAAEQATESDLT